MVLSDFMLWCWLNIYRRLFQSGNSFNNSLIISIVSVIVSYPLSMYLGHWQNSPNKLKAVKPWILITLVTQLGNKKSNYRDKLCKQVKQNSITVKFRRKELRDALQEREGAIFILFWTISKIVFSQSVSLTQYMVLFACLSVRLSVCLPVPVSFKVVKQCCS